MSTVSLLFYNFLSAVGQTIGLAWGYCTALGSNEKQNEPKTCCSGTGQLTEAAGAKWALSFVGSRWRATVWGLMYVRWYWYLFSLWRKVIIFFLSLKSLTIACLCIASSNNFFCCLNTRTNTQWLNLAFENSSSEFLWICVQRFFGMNLNYRVANWEIIWPNWLSPFSKF